MAIIKDVDGNQFVLSSKAVRAMSGFDEPHVLGLAALASSDGEQDPADAAIRFRARSARFLKLFGPAS
jgi:hypothetical protein